MASKAEKNACSITRQELPSNIPEFSIILRTRCSTEQSVIWFKADDVSPSLNRMLNLHRLRTSSSKNPISHTHEGVSYSVLFPVQHSLQRQVPTYLNCEQPPRPSLSASVNNTVYCVGGDENIPYFSRYDDEMYGYPPKPSDDTTVVPFNTCSQVCNLSYRMTQCHFKRKGGGKNDTWTWVESTLISPRYSPLLVTVGDKLYFFGGNRPPFPGEKDRQGHPFAEVYDPEFGNFSPLPDPPFSRIGSFHMRVVPLLGDEGEEKILVISTACNPAPHAGVMYVYDTHDKSWAEFKDDDEEEEDNLFFSLEDMFGDAVPVAQQNTTYWLNGRHTNKPTVSCYDWKTRKLYLSPSLCALLPLRDRPDLLRHLHGDLFCVMWEEFIPHPNNTKKSTTRFHFSLLRISKNNSCASLDTELLGCHSCIAIGFHKIRYAHLLWK